MIFKILNILKNIFEEGIFNKNSLELKIIGINKYLIYKDLSANRKKFFLWDKK